MKELYEHFLHCIQSNREIHSQYKAKLIFEYPDQSRYRVFYRNKFHILDIYDQKLRNNIILNDASIYKGQKHILVLRKEMLSIS